MFSRPRSYGIFYLLVLLSPLFAHGATYSVVPSLLKNSELSEVVDVLGFSTSSKFLSNPYPLGGYAGIEIGVDTEFIDISSLAHYGAGDVTESTFQYTKVAVGKGLFNNFDVFVQFVPFSSGSTIEAYGASVKWTFYEAAYLPLTVSFLAGYDSADIQDVYITEHFSGDFLCGLNVKKFALYFGGGAIAGRNSFSKNTLDGSDTANAQALNSSDYIVLTSEQAHFLLGAHYEIANLFLAAEVDEYQNPVYSAKLGARF